MDLNKLNTVKAAERGAFCHLRNPFNGLLMYDGPADLVDEATGTLTQKGVAALDEHPENPQKAGLVEIGVYVLGSEAPKVTEVKNALSAKRIRAGEKFDFHEAGILTCAALITGFKGIEKDGKLMQPTMENRREFLEASESFITQVTKFSRDNSNFLGKASSE